MKKVVLEEIEYEIIEDYKSGYDYDELKNKYTDYFFPYDYILGDWAYGKLRLKGFCDSNNKLFNKVNDINSLKEYIQNQCAFDCKYFVLKRIK